MRTSTSTVPHHKRKKGLSMGIRGGPELRAYMLLVCLIGKKFLCILDLTIQCVVTWGVMV
eukprot:1155455-Pelagomonas_calceolata.AAC.1